MKDQMIQKSYKSFILSIIVTILLLLAYRIGHCFEFIHTPGYLSDFSFFTGNRFALFSLGIGPLIFCYFLTEIIFLIIPPLRKIRAAGQKGRILINKIAISVSFIYAFFQAWSLVKIIPLVKNSLGQSISYDLNPLKFSGMLLFYMAGFALIILIAHLISKHGIGNGFCLILLMSIIEYVYTNTYSHFSDIDTNYIKPNLIGIVIIVGTIILMYRFLTHPDQLECEIDGHVNMKKFVLPSLIIGAVSLGWAENIFGIASMIKIAFGLKMMTLEHGSWGYAFAISVLTIVFGLFGYLFFSHPKRIFYNTSGKVTVENKKQVNKILLKHLSIGSLFVFLFTCPFPFQNMTLVPRIIIFFNLIALVAIVLDVTKQLIFHKRNLKITALADFDNVHLVSYLKFLFQEKNVPCFYQGYYYRSLFFFWQPLMKMKLFVRDEDVAKAMEILKNEDIKIY